VSLDRLAPALDFEQLSESDVAMGENGSGSRNGKRLDVGVDAKQTFDGDGRSKENLAAILGAMTGFPLALELKESNSNSCDTCSASCQIKGGGLRFIHDFYLYITHTERMTT